MHRRRRRGEGDGETHIGKVVAVVARRERRRAGVKDRALCVADAGIECAVRRSTGVSLPDRGIRAFGRREEVRGHPRDRAGFGVKPRGHVECPRLQPLGGRLVECSGSGGSGGEVVHVVSGLADPLKGLAAQAVHGEDGQRQTGGARAGGVDAAVHLIDVERSHPVDALPFRILDPDPRSLEVEGGGEGAIGRCRGSRAFKRRQPCRSRLQRASEREDGEGLARDEAVATAGVNAPAAHVLRGGGVVRHLDEVAPFDPCGCGRDHRIGRELADQHGASCRAGGPGSSGTGGGPLPRPGVRGAMKNAPSSSRCQLSPIR